MRFLSAMFCALALSLGVAKAAEPDWRIASVAGIVRVAPPGVAPRDAAEGEALINGAVVTTGANSRATLKNGLQTITMAANSRMKLAEDSSDAMTRILQDMGSLLFQVDKRGAPHFRVETPLLAAVVKGTTFTVTAGADGVVHVAEGLVEVRAVDGGAAIDVPGGKTVRIDHTAPTLIVLASASLTNDAAPPPVLNYAAASNGLVENVAAPRLQQAALMRGAEIATGGSQSLGAAQSTMASLNVVGLGGDFTTALGAATGGALTAVKVDTVGAGNISLSAGALANASVGGGGANVGVGNGLANVGASLGGSGGASLGASLGGAAGVDVGLGGANGLANVGANVGDGSLVNVNLNVTNDGGAGASASVAGGAANVGVTAGGGTASVGVGVAGLNVGVNVGGSGGLLGLTLGRRR